MYNIKEKWIRPNSSIHQLVEHLLKISEGFKRNQGFAFFYDYSPGKRNNTDCNLYNRKKIGLVERKKPVTSIRERPNCNKGSFELALLVKEASRSHKSKITDPFTKYYFSGYPEKEISNSVFMADIDETVVFELYHGLSGRSEWWKSGIPVWAHEVQKTMSLKQVAMETTGKESDWKLIWAINLAEIENLDAIKSGKILRIPAEITGWQKTSVEAIDPIIYAKELYSSEEYGPMIQKFMKKTYTKDQEEMWLPLFHDGINVKFYTPRDQVTK